MDLKWESGMDTFLLLLSGKNGCFLILETLDSKKATYLWKLHATELELSDNKELFEQKLQCVEQEISIIRTEGRMAYKRKSSDDFSRVHHDYLKENGLEIWKDRLLTLLDGERS